MKKYFFVFLIGLFAFGCKDNSTNEKIKITILGENSATIQAYMSFEKEYEKQHSNIDLDFKPNTFEDAFSKANQDFANKTGLYDIVLQYNLSLSSYVRNKYVQDIDQLLKDTPDSLRRFEKDLFTNQWQEVGYYYRNFKKPEDGIMKVGYPFAANSMLLMYNKDMFEDLNNRALYKKTYKKDLVVPTNWDDFFSISQFFTNKQKGTYGVCLEGSSNGALYMEWMNFLYGMNGKVMDKNRGWEGDANTQLLLTSPEAIKALKFYTNLKPFNAGGFSNVEFNEQMNIMKQGKTAMAIMWSDMIFPGLKSDKGFDTRFGFSPIPGNKSVSSGGAFFINKQSKHPKEAALYIIDMMQPKVQIELAKKGLCASSKKAYEDPEVKAFPYTEALRVSLERGGVLLEGGPDADMITEVLTNYIQRAWNKELTVEQALAMAQTEIEKKRSEIFSKLN